MRYIKMVAEPPRRYEGHILFDEESVNWQPDPDINRLFLTGVIEHMRQLKQMRGHLFLNEVFDNLGMDRTFAGQTNGWWGTEVSITIHPSSDDVRPWLLIWVERDIHKNLT